MSGGSKSSTVGWRYYFSLFMGLGRGPIDAIREIRIGDRTAWRGNATENTTIQIDAPNLFGGEEKEGGVQGPLQILMGEATQVATPEITSAFGTPQPGFRGVVTAFFDGLLSMNNPYPKAWKYRVNRILKGWDGDVFEPAYAQIPLSTNPGGDALFSQVLVSIPLTANSQRLPGSIGSVNAYIIPFESTPPPPSFNADGMRLGTLNPFDRASAQWTSSFDPDVTFSASSSIRMEVRDFEQTPSSLVPTVLTIGTEMRIQGEGGGPTDLVSVNTNVQYGYFGGIFQWRLIGWTDGFGGYIGTGAIPLGNIASFTVESVFHAPTRQSRFYVNGVLVGFVTLTGTRDTWRLQFCQWFGANTLYAPPTINNLWGARIRALSVSVVNSTTGIGANGAHIIYETMTNRQWGRGLSRAKLDNDSFALAAASLYNEVFPLCMKWLRQDELKSFVQNVQNHIGSVIYTNRQTGLICLKLIRGDYDFDDLPVYDMSNGLLEIREATVNTVSRGVNSINVKWHDPFEDAERSVVVKNAAAIQMAGGVVNSATKAYNGCPTEELALRLGQRDLRASSTLVRRFTVVANRNLANLHPGDVFAMQDAQRGIPKMAVRVGKVKDGTLRDGKIVLDVIQDVFSLPARSFSSGAPSTYVPQDTSPCVDHQRVFEAPYFMLAGRMTPANLDYVNENGGYLAVVSSRGRPTNVSVQIAVRDGLSESEDLPPNDSYSCGI